MALASSEQTVLEVNVNVELVGRAQMANTGKTQGALGMFFIFCENPAQAAK